MVAIHPSTRGLAATAILVVALMACACGKPDRQLGPTLPTIDFTASLILEVDGDQIHWKLGETPQPGTELEPPRLTSGSVLEIANLGDDPVRVRAGSRIDTGTLRPGETTIVLFDETVAEPTVHNIEVDGGEGGSATLELVP